MPGRTYSAAGSYRYGFNGKENDNEVKGEGNQQDYGMRIYDPRLGRFLSVDPLTKDYPWYSPYHFAGNNPIANIDLDGTEDKYYLIEIWLDQSNTKIDKIMIQDVWQQSSNGGAWVRKPQGPEGPGIGLNVQVWHLQGNNYKQQQVANFIFNPPAKQRKGLMDFLDNLFGADQGGGHQRGGIAMYDKHGHGSHSGLTTADFPEIMNNAGAFVHMLGLGGGTEAGIIKNIMDPNKPVSENILSFAETLSHSITLGATTGESIDNLNRKKEENKNSPSAEKLESGKRDKIKPYAGIKPGTTIFQRGIDRPGNNSTVINDTAARCCDPRPATDSVPKRQN